MYKLKPTRVIKKKCVKEKIGSNWEEQRSKRSATNKSEQHCTIEVGPCVGVSHVCGATRVRGSLGRGNFCWKTGTPSTPFRFHARGAHTCLFRCVLTSYFMNQTHVLRIAELIVSVRFLTTNFFDLTSP